MRSGVMLDTQLAPSAAIHTLPEAIRFSEKDRKWFYVFEDGYEPIGGGMNAEMKSFESLRQSSLPR